MPAKKIKTEVGAAAEKDAEPNDEGLHLTLEQKWSLRDYVLRQPVLYQKGVPGWNQRHIRLEAMQAWSQQNGLNGNHHI